MRQMVGLVADEAVLREVQIRFPPDTARPIAALGEAWTGGLQCMFGSGEGAEYIYVSSKVKKMQQYCRQVHGWENKQRRGRLRRDGREEEQQEVL